MKQKLFRATLKLVSIMSEFAAMVTVNSTCNLIVYEPKVPKAAERLVKQVENVGTVSKKNERHWNHKN